MKSTKTNETRYPVQWYDKEFRENNAQGPMQDKSTLKTPKTLRLHKCCGPTIEGQM